MSDMNAKDSLGWTHFDKGLHQWTQRYCFYFYEGNIDMNAEETLGKTACKNGHK